MDAFGGGKLYEFCVRADSRPFQPATHLNYAKTRPADAFLFIHYRLWLDLSDYRAFLDLSVKDASDEQLLEAMHTIRTRSKYLPEEVRRESKIWLAKHEPLEKL